MFVVSQPLKTSAAVAAATRVRTFLDISQSSQITKFNVQKRAEHAHWLFRMDGE